jgi:hypothetical protein
LSITGKKLLQIYISSSSNAYNNKAVGKAAVYEWFRHFKKNQQLLENDPKMGKGHYEPH